MMRSITLCAALAALVAPATVSLAQAPAPVTAQAYVANAAASDQFEIQSSQVALQKATSPQVRQFAQMMIDHHTKTSADLMAAAKTAGVPAPPMTLPADKAQKVEGLRSGAATGFDDRYMREQVMGHQEALALHTAYARSGDNATLKAAAAKTAPIVQQHLTQVQGMVRGMSGGADATTGAGASGGSSAGAGSAGSTSRTNTGTGATSGTSSAAGGGR